MYVISENIHNVEGKRFSCERCNKTFSTSKAVQDHVRQKHQKFHMCTLCERIFTAKAKLMSHLTNDHYFDGTEDNLFLCPLCQAKLPTSVELNEHLNSQHQMLKEHTCPHCDHQASAKFMATIHLLEGIFICSGIRICFNSQCLKIIQKV